MSQKFPSPSTFPPRQAPHDSAIGHVSGSANYIDDQNTPHNTHHMAFVLSPIAHGKISSIDMVHAQSMPGVRAILTAKELASECHCFRIGAVQLDEPLLAQDEVLFCGQAVAVVLAQTHTQALQAAAKVQVKIEEKEAIISIEQAISRGSYLDKPVIIHTGDAAAKLQEATHQIEGILSIGGQEHFYLETQVALSIPGEKDEIVLHSSTQNPTEIQHLVAKVLGVPMHAVEVVTRRMGGGFGGKETNASQIACLSAILCKKYQVPVKARLPRLEDFLMTGKRHDFRVDYQVGFDAKGIIQSVIMDYYARCGYSMDLSYAIVNRALMHADNAYYLENAKIQGFLCQTHTPSNTAFRGFGGPQGMLAIENIVEEIAQYLGEDARVIRQRNFYQKSARNHTPYGQKVKDNILPELSQQLLDSSDYQKRRKVIEQFNQDNPILKKGLAFSPVKFGISFNTTFLNQAGALVHVYKDGSVYLNHGGTEMGQGLFTKVASVVAQEFGLSMACIKVSATNTTKIPNTSATAASSGADLNGKATQIACQCIKENMLIFAQDYFAVDKNQVTFFNNQVIITKSSETQSMAFKSFVELCYLNRVALFSNGFYKTPKIHYDKKSAKGRPFYYYAYGVAVTEVMMDTLTGEYKLTAVDILHDVGKSLNLAIDMGQIVGGYIQGFGWLCTEDLRYNQQGQLLTTGPTTYKIPSIEDLPRHFHVEIQQQFTASEETIFRSKAVGEPPLMLAISAWLAIKNAIYNATGSIEKSRKLQAPATFENVWRCLK